jgi:hypothetical protein
VDLAQEGLFGVAGVVIYFCRAEEDDV